MSAGRKIERGAQIAFDVEGPLPHVEARVEGASPGMELATPPKTRPAADTKPPVPNDPAWQPHSYDAPVTADVEMHDPVAFEALPFSIDSTLRVWVMWETTLVSNQAKELQCLLGCSSGAAQGFISDANGPWEADSTGTTVELGASGAIPCAG